MNFLFIYFKKIYKGIKVVLDMKKKVFFGFVILTLLIFPFVFAVQNETTQVQKAYACLNNTINTKGCSQLSTEQQSFALLSEGKCEAALLNNSNGESWNHGDIKTTAQAILALDSVGKNTTKEENWLLAQNKTFSNFNWFLEIDNSGESSCNITGGNSKVNLKIGADKKINSLTSNNCLSISSGGWWLSISPSCYDKTFEITCNKSFLTDLLYTKNDSSTIHVLGGTHSSSEGGTTSEKINLLCFKSSNNECNYGGSLWATSVLSYKGRDVSLFLPYLTSLEDSSSNQRYLPDSFLYNLIGNSYETKLLEGQKNNQYWDVSGNKFYDTAIALIPFRSGQNTPSEEKGAKTWLLNEQDSSGCWNNNNIVDTASILYSVWPNLSPFNKGTTTGTANGTTNGTDEIATCQSLGYFCETNIACSDAQGNELQAYSNSCGYPNLCCDKSAINNLNSTGGNGNGSGSGSGSGNGNGNGSGSGSGNGNGNGNGGGINQTVQGTDCSNNGGMCIGSCSNAQFENDSYSCGTENSNVCCFTKTSSSSSGFVWYFLGFLILLTILGLIFKEKLKVLIARMTSKGRRDSGKNSFNRRFPRFPPNGSRRPLVRRSRVRPSIENSQGHANDVLKRLKEMSK